MNTYLIIYLVSIPVTYFTVNWINKKCWKYEHPTKPMESKNWSDVFYLALFSLLSVVLIIGFSLYVLIDLKIIRLPSKPPKWL